MRAAFSRGYLYSSRLLILTSFYKIQKYRQLELSLVLIWTFSTQYYVSFFWYKIFDIKRYFQLNFIFKKVRHHYPHLFNYVVNLQIFWECENNFTKTTEARCKNQNHARPGLVGTGTISSSLKFKFESLIKSQKHIVQLIQFELMASELVKFY